MIILTTYAFVFQKWSHMFIEIHFCHVNLIKFFIIVPSYYKMTKFLTLVKRTNIVITHRFDGNLIRYIFLMCPFLTTLSKFIHSCRVYITNKKNMTFFLLYYYLEIKLKRNSSILFLHNSDALEKYCYYFPFCYH